MNKIESKSFSAGGRVYEVKFTSYACYLLEVEMGVSAIQVAQRIGEQRGLYREAVSMMYAGLEGARNDRPNPQAFQPYSIAGASRIVDELGIVPALKILTAAFSAALPKRPVQEEAPQEVVEGGPLEATDQATGAEGDPLDSGSGGAPIG